jgi:hypothetical protein
MATINVSENTKEKFKTSKLKESAKKNKNLSEDDFENILLDKLEGKK